ncbi:hypothetical protein, partial [Clostridium celatum]|uniref:hypothetical protein n=1 Tax=Clostridium celatum TaxID=36834 RepID=UPI0018983122
MFNSKYKKEALEDLKETGKRYDEKYKIIIKDITLLHELKVESVSLIKEIEEYYSKLANKPKEFKKIISEIKANYEQFQSQIEEIEIDAKKAEKIAGGVAGAGVATGVGVAAFGPSIAMAVATTFGTASTGTAIASLSGAAATNAALAWLGGGALAAGGGGMAAGSAFLALAGPIGWAIGGSAIVGGGLLANSKNKKIAKEAEEQTKKINIATNSLNKLDIKVNNCKKEIIDIKSSVSYIFMDIMKKDIKDYNDICKLADSGDKEGKIYKYGLMHLLNLT